MADTPPGGEIFPGWGQTENGVSLQHADISDRRAAGRRVR
jgi:hypothetical protein